MRLLPAVNAVLLSLFFLSAGTSLVSAQTQPSEQDQSADIQQAAQVLQALEALQAAQVETTGQTQGDQVSPSALETLLKLQQAEDEKKKKGITQQELNQQLQDPDSAQTKAHALAKKSRKDLSLFGTAQKIEKKEGLIDAPVPPPIEKLQKIRETFGEEYTDPTEGISEKAALDMRKDAQKEAALSYGARGGLAHRSYQVMESMYGYGPVLDKVFNFRALLIKAPSGLLIEPPIVKESLDAMVIDVKGDEAAVADQILKINRQAKIVAAPRDWRQYLDMTYTADIPPPPRILWPKDSREQAEWDGWIRQGWKAGVEQADQIFDTNVNQMAADYSGMVRYRMLLAQGKISQPYALHEERGVTGNKDEMRVGDRALKITGPSQFLTGAESWKPADR